jgi:DNA ligase-associated metallophosphoesterase
MTAAAARDHVVEVGGESLVLLPERAAFWTRTRTLLLADPHFGKGAAFRAAGIPVPRGATTEGLARLDAALSRTAARRVVVLGDFLHAREGRDPESMRVLTEWRSRCPDLDLTLVRGNHDRRAGDPPPELRVACVTAPLLEPPFVFAHHPRESADGYVLAGHLHPGVRLSGRGRQHARLACFWFGATVGVLPAFGDFTGLADVEPAPNDRVCVIVEQQVTEIATQRSEPC